MCHWTTKKPIEGGWYWYRPAPEYDGTVVEVLTIQGVLHCRWVGWKMLNDLKGEWSSEPILPPKEKKAK